MSDKLCEKAKAAAARESMLAPGDTVLVGLVGGADSVALLRFFLEEKEEMGLRLVAAAHLNHGLRGTRRSGTRCLVRPPVRGVGGASCRFGGRRWAAWPPNVPWA